MDNNKNTAQGGNTNPDAGDDRTFSQDDVNRIVGERLAKEKAKIETALSEREQDLVQRELSLAAREALTVKGLSVELAGAINMKDAETLKRSIEIIEAEINKHKTKAPTFIGITPGKSSGRSPSVDNDAAIRMAMGLK